ncbi:hypothetical protein EJB05_10398, partial [Eragrostis curvula]
MAMRISNPFPQCAVSFAILLQLVALAAAQPGATPPAPPPGDAGCNGILLNYTFDGRDKIRPFVPAANSQPYSFRATATVLNSGTHPLRSWALLLTFAHGEVLVGVDGAVLTTGGDLPYNTTTDNNATSFSGFPQTDLLTPIATAGDLSKIQATVKLVGTLFAGPEPYVPLPSALSLGDPAYACAPPTNVSTSMSTCCILLKPAAAAGNGSELDGAAARRRSFLPRGTGDLVISYDVLQSSYDHWYLAQVTLENMAPLARLDGWQLSWEWQRHEFINSMHGAYPLEIDTASCLYGPQGQHYTDFDFSNTLTCAPRPVVLDLPPTSKDTDMGRIEHCCRNGTILPKSMDVAQSKSAFRMEVYKMPPDLNRTELYPPANFRIAGSLPQNPDYTCGQPVPVSPTEFPDPSGLPSTTLAVATWQVICNITTNTSSGSAAASSSSKPPTCCVSFSAFYNESVVPCNTCACGCPRTNATTSSCSTTAPPMLLPPYALLMPFERRAKEALVWAHDHRLPVPNPLPCADNCGVTINWHLAADFAGGWSARVTLFNWDDGADMPDWFAAVVMRDNAYAGFEQAYSFNATAVGNDTIFMKGREGFNEFLLRETNVSGVDYPVPGKLQSVLSFTKKMNPDIDVLAGDGFPSKVFFNGDECAMPLRIPSHGVHTRAGTSTMLLLLSLLASSLLLLLP